MNPVSSEYKHLLGIGSVRTAQGTLEYPFSWRDAEIDINWMADDLRRLQIERGSLIHITHSYKDIVQFWPIYHGARVLGAVYANGMATPFDAYRLEMYLRRFKFDVVFGTTVETLDGLQQGGHDIGKVFSTARLCIALPDAAARLREAGVAAGNLLMVGPFLAIEAAPGEGARFNNREWTVEAIDGELHVTSTSPRAARFERIATGVKGRVEKVSTRLGPEWRIFADA